MKSFCVVNDKGEELNTNVSLHPGEVLRMELNERKFQYNQFSILCGISIENLTKILNGRQNIDKNLAKNIESILGIESGFWLRMQRDYTFSVNKMNT